MAEQRLKTKTEVIQVQDGFEYKGTVTLNSTTFDYTVKFHQHMEKIDNLKGSLGSIKIDVKKGDQTVSLTDEETNKFFTYMILRHAFEFYGHPQTRASQKMANNPRLEDFGINTEFSMSFSGSVAKSPTLEKLMKDYQ